MSLWRLEYVIVSSFSNNKTELNNLNLASLLICAIVGLNLWEKFNFSISLSRIIPQSNFKFGALSLFTPTTYKSSKISIVLFASTTLTASSFNGKLFIFTTFATCLKTSKNPSTEIPSLNFKISSKSE